MEEHAGIVISEATSEQLDFGIAYLTKVTKMISEGCISIILDPHAWFLEPDEFREKYWNKSGELKSC